MIRKLFYNILISMIAISYFDAESSVKEQKEERDAYEEMEKENNLSGYDDAVGVYDSDRENYARYGGERRTGKKSEGCQQRVFPVRTRKKESIIIRFVPSEEKLLEHSAVPYRFVR